MQFFFWFVSIFEHVNFAINWKYSKNIYDNSNYYVSLVIFQTYKNVILRIAYSFGWFFLLWFYHVQLKGKKLICRLKNNL
jgi:hypothetical protein